MAPHLPSPARPAPPTRSTSLPPPSARSASSSSSGNTNKSSTQPQQQQPQWASAKVLDRGLFRRFEEVSEELARLTRLSSQLEAPPVGSSSPEIEKVRGELKRVQRSSSMVLQSQRELQEKIARQERTSLRRFFSLNRDQKTERLKLKLCEKMAESLTLDAQLEHLERKSDSLLEDWRSSLYSTSIVGSIGSSGGVANPDADLAERKAELEREKQDLLRELLSAVKVPEVAQLQTRIAMCTSEVKACESAQKQVEKITVMYRKALQLLRTALAEVVADNYTGSVMDFVSGPFANTVEAGQLIEVACTFVQPESRRRYREHAPELGYVQVPKFPQAIADFARRTRANFDPNSGLAIEASRMLETGENVIVLMHRIAIQKLEVLEQWSQAVEHDHERAAKEQQRLETRLQQRLAALARSVSA